FVAREPRAALDDGAARVGELWLGSQENTLLNSRKISRGCQGTFSPGSTPSGVFSKRQRVRRTATAVTAMSDEQLDEALLALREIGRLHRKPSWMGRP